MPIRPKHMLDCFSSLGIITSCTKSCSWNSYMEYLDILRDIRYRIEPFFSGNVQLIDAHSNDLREDSFSMSQKDYSYREYAENKPEEILLCGHKTYLRNRQTSINALVHTGYQCENDTNHPTFQSRKSGKPYTEPHHLIRMAYQGRFRVSVDREQNIISLCSNCHNEIHYGMNAREMVRRQFAQRKEALKRAVIIIGLDELIQMYGPNNKWWQKTPLTARTAETSAL